LAKVPQLKRFVVLSTGDIAKATETVDIQRLPVIPGLNIEVLRRPQTTGDLVRLLRDREVTNTNTADE